MFPSLRMGPFYFGIAKVQPFSETPNFFAVFFTIFADESETEPAMDIDLLAKMVKEAILDHDTVTLPGVGCFVAELVPSTFPTRDIRSTRRTAGSISPRGRGVIRSWPASMPVTTTGWNCRWLPAS